MTGLISDDALPLDGPPTVGLWYFVPTLWAASRLAPEESFPVPVIGVPHNDDGLPGAKPGLHIHLDARFLDNDTICRVSDPSLVADFTPADILQKTLLVVWGPTPGLDPWLSPFRCWRAEPPTHGKQFVAGRVLERRYRHATLPPCRTCPHQGTPLASVAPDEFGVLTCPAHLLGWDSRTGRLVPRVCAGDGDGSPVEEVADEVAT